MEFSPVQSSTVAGIAWEAGRLWVKYRAGDVYSCEATAAEYAYLMAAPSKGSHLGLHFKQRLKFESKSGEGAQAQTVSGTFPAEQLQLNTHAADTCCSKPLIKALHANELNGKDSWVCPKCGVTWKAGLVQDVKHWEPATTFEVFKMPRR